MLNLDAAEQAGIKVPEKLDILRLDELLRQADEAGVPGLEGMSALDYCGIRNLRSGMYLSTVNYEEVFNPSEQIFLAFVMTY